MAKKKYPVVNKILWEAFRSFGGAFMSSIALQLSIGIDLQDWRMWAFGAITASLAAGFGAVGKWLREMKPEDYSNVVFKLPI